MSKKKPDKKRVEHTSADLLLESIARLRELFPQAVTEGKIDFAKLRETLGDEVDDRPERYSFSWAGKRDAIRLLQVPSRATLVPAPKESINFDETQNLFIEGENLEVLKLLYKSYAGGVKMIYIDPPYNTGNDFIYPDDFRDPLDTYLKLTGQKDAEGNLLTSIPEKSGRYHSTWLSMMYPRLFVARQLLAEEGLIFVSIDDREIAPLRLLMNEVFGEENFLAVFARRTKSGGGSASDFFAIEHDYVMAFARAKESLAPLFVPHDEDYAKRFSEEDKEGRFYWDTMARSSTATKPYAIIAPDGTRLKGHWFRGEERFKQDLKKGDVRIVKKEDGSWSVQFKQRMGQGRKLRSLMYENEFKSSQAELDEFSLYGFQHPKPVFLLKALIQAGTGKGDLVLDFFAGSCTTADSLLLLNREDGGSRSFIMVQIPEPIPDASSGRKGGLLTIADVGKERVRRAIRALKDEAKGKLDLKDRETPEDLGFKVFKLAESNYRPWKGVEKNDGVAYAKTMELFTDPLVPGWKPVNMVYEVALKEGYRLTSKVEKVEGFKDNTVYRVTDADKGQSLRISLDDRLKATTVKALVLKKDDLFICRDSALSDEQAANLALQCNLKTI